MESGNINLLNLITSIISLLLLFLPAILVIIKKWKISKATISVKLPPGPKKLPLIGDLHRMTSIPFRCFRDLSQQYGPIMHLKLGDVSTIVVSSPEIAKEILKEHDPNFADRPDSIGFKSITYGYRDIAFSPYGDYWRQMRRICILELLSAKMVRSFGTIRDDEIYCLIKSIHLSSGNPINLTQNIFSMTSSIICRAAFGKVCKENDYLVKLMKQGIQMAGGFEIADLFPSRKIIKAVSWTTQRRLVMMQRKIDMILDGIITEHKENWTKIGRRENLDSARKANGDLGDEDLVDVLLRIKESEELEFPIGNDNIKAIIFEMFLAATDTTASTIDWTMVELLRNPQVMAKAQAEVREVFKESKMIKENDVHKLKYLKLVIMESLRLHPPGPLIPRASREECEINGYTIPAKVKVIVNSWAIQRDPKYGSVNFTGGDFQFLPFGSGKRMCPGMTFALATVELSLAQILYNFNWELPHGIKAEALDMTENFGAAVPRKDELFVVATPYESLAS